MVQAFALLIAASAIVWTVASMLGRPGTRRRCNRSTSGSGQRRRQPRRRSSGSDCANLHHEGGRLLQERQTSTLKDLSVERLHAKHGVISGGPGLRLRRLSSWRRHRCAELRNRYDSTKGYGAKNDRKVASITSRIFAGFKCACWTCHRQQERPATSMPSIIFMMRPYVEDPDIAFNGVGKLTADQILDKYIQPSAAPSAWPDSPSSWTRSQRRLRGFGGEGQVTIYAKSPNQRNHHHWLQGPSERGGQHLDH